MSVIINIENFANFSSVFEEIDRRIECKRNVSFGYAAAKTAGTGKRDIEERFSPQQKGCFFATENSDKIKMQNQERKPRSFTEMEAQSTKHRRLRRLASVPNATRHNMPQPRARIRSTPCPSIDPAIFEGDTRLTENAKGLNDEELRLLYEDILKPLDFYSILHDRRKENDELNR